MLRYVVLTTLCVGLVIIKMSSNSQFSNSMSVYFHFELRNLRYMYLVILSTDALFILVDLFVSIQSI
jgi:hypothetical protein